MRKVPASDEFVRCFQVQHEQSLQLESLIVGAAAHVLYGSYGSVGVGASSPLFVVIFTSTGIAEPVAKRNSR
jgi:hypothetical protein